MPLIDPNVVEAYARFMALFILIGIALFLVWLVTVIDIVKSDFKTSADKIVWFFFVMLLPPVGIIMYCAIGRSQKIDAEPSVRSTRYREIGRD
jgi:hypothetical protein